MHRINNIIMTTKRKSSFSALLLPLFLIIVTACAVDPSYNLDEKPIDPSVTLFQDGLTIPIGSSERIRLDTLIKRIQPAVDDYLVEGDDGSYTFCYDGSFSLNDQLKDLDLGQITSIDGISFSQGFTLHTDELDQNARSYDVDYTYTATLKDFPIELKELEEVVFDEVYLNMEAIFDSLPDDPKAAINVDLEIGLPSFITPNSISIKGTVADNRFAITPIKLEKISGVEIPENGSLEVEVTIVGQISANDENIDLSAFQKDIVMTVNASLQDENGKLSIAKARGKFSYDFSQTTTIPLNTLPEILKDDSMCIDLSNPRISLGLTTNVGIPLSGSLEIVPFVDDQPLTDNIITLENVVLPCSASASQDAVKAFCICNDKASVPAGYEFLKADLSKILKQIPDSIQIRIDANAGGGTSAVIEPKAQYKFDIDYGIRVPLAFGEDFYITADTEIDLSGVQAVTSMGEFGIKGKVVNETPLSLSVELNILDAEGEIIPQSKPNIISIDGKATSDIDVSIYSADKDRAIAKARLTISITAVSDEPVKPSECLQFIDLVAVAPEGLTIDPELLPKI